MNKSIADEKDTSGGLFNFEGYNPLVSVCVVVPARNEAKSISKALDALRNQTNPKGSSIPHETYEVLLLVNNCTDNTFLLAEKYQKLHPNFQLYIEKIQLPQELANIGTVRRLLMDAAYKRLCKSGNGKGIIASTDSDTKVDTNWIYFTKKEIVKGNDAVGGRILSEKITHGARTFHEKDTSYRLLLAKAESLIDPDPSDPWPRHFQYFGASLAVTCNMYHKCGRLPQVPFLEDGAFHRLLLLADAKIRKTPAVKVYTSPRMHGRVNIGFSEQLKKWNKLHKANHQQLVGSVKAQLLIYRLRNILRNCWQENKVGDHKPELINKIAKLLLLKPKWLHTEITSCQYFGLLWEKVSAQKGFSKWIEKYQSEIPITQAIIELRCFLKPSNVDKHSAKNKYFFIEIDSLVSKEI